MRGWPFVLLVACSSGGKPVHPTPDPGHGSAASHPVDDNDCNALVSHAIELRVAELHATPDAGVPSDADQQQVRDQINATVGAECHKLSRDVFRCAIAATTTEALVACDH